MSRAGPLPWWTGSRESCNSGGEPLSIRRLEGSLGFQDGTLRFQLSPLVLPKSRLSGFGTIGFGDEPRPPLDVALRIDTLAFSDLGKVYGSIPEEGGAELVLVAERRDEGTVILVRDLDLRAPGTALHRRVRRPARRYAPLSADRSASRPAERANR